MYAYQQLATETYNDALTRSAGIDAVNPTFSRPSVFLPDAVRSAHEILPALERKLEILDTMRQEHEYFGRPRARSSRRAYDGFGSALKLMLERGRFQLDEAQAWINEPERESGKRDVLAAPEQTALVASATSLNTLISDLHLEAADWIEIVRSAFNGVRATVGLSPMEDEEFRTTYFRSLAGDVVHFFS